MKPLRANLDKLARKDSGRLEYLPFRKIWSDLSGPGCIQLNYELFNISDAFCRQPAEAQEDRLLPVDDFTEEIGRRLKIATLLFNECRHQKTIWETDTNAYVHSALAGVVSVDSPTPSNLLNPGTVFVA